MSFFEDKEYENLDWLNAAMEVPSFSLNDKAAQLKDRYELGYEEIVRLNGLNTLSMLIECIKNDKVRESMTPKEISIITDRLYFIEYEEDTILNCEDETLSNPIFLVKRANIFEEKALIDTVKGMMWAILNGGGKIDRDKQDISRLNEIMDTIGCDTERKSKSRSKKQFAILRHMTNILKDDTWNIRNMDLHIKAAEWIMDYSIEGNLAAITNLIKLKCMTHSGNPIYSMKEVV